MMRTGIIQPHIISDPFLSYTQQEMFSKVKLLFHVRQKHTANMGCRAPKSTVKHLI